MNWSECYLHIKRLLSDHASDMEDLPHAIGRRSRSRRCVVCYVLCVVVCSEKKRAFSPLCKHLPARKSQLTDCDEAELL